MQTFITDFALRTQIGVPLNTARALDSARLGKQRVEAQQIWASLETGKGWRNHPATKMWDGHQEALACYGWYACLEWRIRGFNDTVQEFFSERLYNAGADIDWPWWFGHKEMVESHRSKLLRKDMPFYTKHLKGPWQNSDHYVGLKLPYLWPDMKEQCFRLSGAEYKRADWEIPNHWYIDSNRKVYFKEDQVDRNVT